MRGERTPKDVCGEASLFQHSISSLRSKRFQSSYSKKVRAAAKKMEGGGEKRKRLPAKPHDSGKRPLIFHGSVICKLTERQDRFTRLASHTDVLRGSSRVPASRVTNP